MSTIGRRRAQDDASLCHPGRVHHAFGLCTLCYQARYREQHVNDKPLTRRRNKVMGLLGLGDQLPILIPNVEHRALTEIPVRCLKCGNPYLVVEGRRIHCSAAGAGCGSDWYLVRRPEEIDAANTGEETP
jgi:hypothetical protein